MASSRRQYPFHLIEPKWQQFWDEQQTFRAFNPGEVLPDGHPFARRHNLSGKVAATQLPPKFYILDMFPYPSGAGLHVGHPEGYTATDILARYKRAQGFHVLHPMGWDAFGLPAEQYAVKTGQHPRNTTEANIATFKRQIQSLGFSYDWSRELATTDPNYFKWTQWIFLKLYNSWFNPKTNRAEPIETLKYPKKLSGRDALPRVQADRQVGPTKQGNWHVIEYNIRIGVTSGPMILRMLKNPVETLLRTTRNEKLDPPFGVPPSGGSRRRPLKGGTPNQFGCSLTLAGYGYPFTQVRGPHLPLEVDGKFDCDVWWNEVARGADGNLIATGHRIADVIALAPKLDTAIAKAYANIRKIRVVGSYFRTDVGQSLWPPGNC